MNEVIEVGKGTVYVLLGVIGLLEVAILLFQAVLFRQRKEIKELLRPRRLELTQEDSPDVHKSNRKSSS